MCYALSVGVNPPGPITLSLVLQPKLHLAFVVGGGKSLVPLKYGFSPSFLRLQRFNALTTLLRYPNLPSYNVMLNLLQTEFKQNLFFIFWDQITKYICWSFVLFLLFTCPWCIVIFTTCVPFVGWLVLFLSFLLVLVPWCTVFYQLLECNSFLFLF